MCSSFIQYTNRHTHTLQPKQLFLNIVKFAFPRIFTCLKIFYPSQIKTVLFLKYIPTYICFIILCIIFYDFASLIKLQERRLTCMGLKNILFLLFYPFYITTLLLFEQFQYITSSIYKHNFSAGYRIYKMYIHRENVIEESVHFFLCVCLSEQNVWIE